MAEATDLQAPPYVVTHADRERWALSGDIAEALWELYEEGPLDREWLWQMQRSIYRQEIPTGIVPLAEAEEVEPDADAAAVHEHAWALWQNLEASKPRPEAHEAEHWLHVARVCDLFDELFGNPDHIELGGYENAMPLHEAAAGSIEEAFGRVFHGAYSAGLHPRDRLGKWSQKLNGIRAAAHDKGAALRQNVAGAVASRRAEHDAEKLRVHARVHTKVKHAHAHAMASLAYVYSEDAAKKLGGFHENVKDAGAALETVDRAQHISNVAHEGARWAVEHQHEIRTVVHALGHAARAVGIAAAATDEDAADAAVILESLSA